MRTTLDIDDELLDSARRRAAERGSTLTAFVEQALAAALAAPSRRSKRFVLRWKTHRGSLRAGVDIADRDGLFDVMEGRR
ncbi:MAG: type II toxin-antitoxin system VapB family antitoxin [Deltaproteobacteria bacterium]|nr:type II toxin-antitoxin system VapB family antitoxin [Deltaproteobacteria bacterium]